jgi:hypothetical protein
MHHKQQGQILGHSNDSVMSLIAGRSINKPKEAISENFACLLKANAVLF